MMSLSLSEEQKVPLVNARHALGIHLSRHCSFHLEKISLTQKNNRQLSAFTHGIGITENVVSRTDVYPVVIFHRVNKCATKLVTVNTVFHVIQGEYSRTQGELKEHRNRMG